nr:extensin-like [Aegilops tauschii subsp. strangulata]
MSYDHAATAHIHAKTPRSSPEPPSSCCGTPPKMHPTPGHGCLAPRHPKRSSLPADRPATALARSPPPPTHPLPPSHGSGMGDQIRHQRVPRPSEPHRPPQGRGATPPGGQADEGGGRAQRPPPMPWKESRDEDLHHAGERGPAAAYANRSLASDATGGNEGGGPGRGARGGGARVGSLSRPRERLGSGPWE